MSQGMYGKWESRQTKNAEHKQNRYHVVGLLSKQGSEMNRFCPKQGQGLKDSAAHRHPNVP